MKIIDVETAWISMPLPTPRGLSGGPIRSSTDAVCRIRTDEGIYGIGESRGGPLYCFRLALSDITSLDL